MTQPAQPWTRQLRDFLHHHGAEPAPKLDSLSPLQRQQAHISGHSMLQFFALLEHEDDALGLATLQPPLQERAFVFITDDAGTAAAQDLIESDSSQVVVLKQDLWRAFIDDEANDDDSDFRQHFHFWSVWTRDIPQAWRQHLGAALDYWVHEEGFMLATELGRGAKHLWRWHGDELTAVEGMTQSWVV